MERGVKVKVCGMRDAENILEVAALHPDYMGFIFYEASARCVGADFEISNELDSSINKVGVFVNHSISFIKETMVNHHLQFAQLHGDESVAFCEELKSDGVRIIKVFRIDEDFDFANTKQFETVSDYFLFDTKGKLYGGNARTFDWNLLTRYNQAIPFFLSGGVQADKLGGLKDISSLNIHAIDINSGVEIQPGLKNVHKITAIINQLSL
jgi:phosphoribosylanthranilate isomerase